MFPEVTDCLISRIEDKKFFFGLKPKTTKQISNEKKEMMKYVFQKIKQFFSTSFFFDFGWFSFFSTSSWRHPQQNILVAGCTDITHVFVRERKV